MIDGLCAAFDERRGRGCRKVLALLDEAGRAPIAGLPEYAATVAGRNISLWLAYQSRSQPAAIYGDKRAEILHAPYHVRVISAATHEAPYVLDGLLHHGTSLKIDTHYVDTGGVSDHVFILCVMLGFRLLVEGGAGWAYAQTGSNGPSTDSHKSEPFCWRF